MHEVRFSKRAKDDIAKIAQYTIGQFGIEQARIYRDAMIACFNALAGNPKFGKSVEDIRKGYRRVDFRSHAIFYKVDGQRILIMRILHSSMNAPRHL